MRGSKVAHNDLGGIAPDAVHDEYRRRGAGDWPDRALVEAAGESVETVDPVEPVDGDASRSVERIAADVIAAIGAGDLDLVDRLAEQLSAHATALELRRLLGDAVAPSLAAAGHGSILLSLLPRIGAAYDVPLSIVRGPVRELARYPDWRIRWFDAPDLAESGPPLLEALLAVPVLGSPGSDFIFPVMNQVEASGVAAELLAGAVAGPVDVHRARRDITRVAAWSMLQEPPAHAPYGWTHCLTMSQAVMNLAGDGVQPRTALAVAATFVAGFRSALGSVPLDPTWQPGAPNTTDLGDAIASGPREAAATTWHAPDSQLDLIASELAARASRHHDAHLVKYTLACFDAADDDPAQRRLYLAAAASLSGWWAQHPGPG